MSHYKRVDTDWLSLPHQTEGSEGLIATLHADGQLARLGVYAGGKLIGCELVLEPGKASATGLFAAEPGMSSDFERYTEDGCCERFDPWSDNSRPHPQDFGKWVRTWIARIEVDAKRYAEEPPMCRAARSGDVESLKRLLDKKQPVDVLNGAGQTPLMEASAAGHGEAVALLINAGSKVNRPRKQWHGHKSARVATGTALSLAVEGGHVAVVEQLLAAQAESTPDHQGETPLHVAANAGHAEVVARLLEAGHAPDAADHSGRQPAHRAANRGVMQRLLDAGADPNAADRHGWSPLFWALHLERPLPVVKLLVEHGADIRHRGGGDRGVLDFAGTAAAKQLMKRLLDDG